MPLDRQQGNLNSRLLLGELFARRGDKKASRSWWDEAAKLGSVQAKALLKLSEWRYQDPVIGALGYVEVDHLYQGWNNCGATSLTMFLRHAGVDATPYDVKRLCPQSPIGTGTDWAHLAAAGEKLGRRLELLTFTNDDTGFTSGAGVIREHLDAGARW